MITPFLHDGDQVIADLDGAWKVLARYVYGPGIDELLVMFKAGLPAATGAAQAGKPYYFHADALGSIIALTDSRGQLVESYRYDAFGTPTILDPAGQVRSTSVVGNRFLFTGREYDFETGLYYYRNRYFHPGLGRFTSHDPLGVLPDVNLYRYVGNNSTTLVDPLGLYTVVIHGVDFTPQQPYEPGYSGRVGTTLRDRGETVQEVVWSGNLSDQCAYGQVAQALQEGAAIAAARGESLSVVTHSWGSVLAGEVIRGTGIRVDNLVTLGSPSSNFSGLASRWLNIWSPLDPISFGSAWAGTFNPNQYDIYRGVPHLNYWDHPEVARLTADFVGAGGSAKQKK